MSQSHNFGPLSHNIMVERDSKILIDSIKRADSIPWSIKILIQVNINLALGKNFLFAERRGSLSSGGRSLPSLLKSSLVEIK